jgi:tetratricopeptide (TPR) repeat protein
VLASHLTHAEEYARAIEQAQKAIDIDERHWLPHMILGEIYITMGKSRAAIAAAERARALLPAHAMSGAILAAAFRRAGEAARTREILAQMGDTPKPIAGRVLYHVASAEIEAAAGWFAKMVDEREPLGVIIANIPLLKPLRESAHWPRLARMMNLQ